MLDPEEIEDEIIAALEPIVSPLPVEPTPERFREYIEEKITSAVGVVLVQWIRYRPAGGDEKAQADRHEVEISIINVDARPKEGHRGTYGAIVGAVEAFKGKSLTIGGMPYRTTVRDAAFRDVLDAHYVYGISLSIESILSHTT